MGLGGQHSRRVRHLGTTWHQTALAYAVRLLLSMQVVQLVGAPLNKNVMELKTPKQEVQERYLPLKAGRLTSADATPQEEPSRVSDFQEAAYMGQTGHAPALCAQVHMWHMCMCR
jgi:hypothetical protein